ncbi:hypothetical protein HC031_05040 [Planosporangium thailandense]|uniref:Uncharacterized protein n=1 Tax=Planosporangium thailandense TaxID=765197 RepID=A0ABX0XSV5_9ACTN|nr:hypothetical protein [Planosporangium thailandense]NJC69092.1 hypothetical protein [Planosporangium thailandense]
MRIPRRIAITVAAAVAAVAATVADPWQASARSVLVSLTLSPSSGPSTTTITATYRYVPLGRKGPNGGCGAEVTFTWDGQRLQGPGRPNPAGTYCAATLTFTPPKGLDSPGPHTVAGTQDTDTAQAQFTVTGSGTPAPVPSPPPTAPSPVPATIAPATSVHPGPSVTPTATPSPSASAPASTDPLPSEEPSDAGGSGIAGATTKPPAGSSVGTVLAVLLGLFTMVGGSVLLTLALRRRPDVDAAEAPDDATTAEA